MDKGNKDYQEYDEIDDSENYNSEHYSDQIRNANRTYDQFYDNIRNFWLKYPSFYNAKSYRDATPDEYYLYGKTMLLYSFRKCSKVKEINEYSNFYIYECHISNPKQFHIDLINEGYFEPPNDYDYFTSYLVAELKIICESIGCKKSGTKAELIHRIISSLSNEEIEKYKEDSKCYCLSEKGIFFLQSNYDYVEFNKNREIGISLAEFNDYRVIGNKIRKYNDTIFHILADKIYKNSAEHNYRDLQKYYAIIANIYLDNGIMDMAIDCCLKSLYLSTCCIYYAELYSNISYIVHKVEFNNTFPINPNIMETIALIAPYYSSKCVDNIFALGDLPPSFLSKDEFKEVVNDMCTSTIFDYEKYNRIIWVRLNEYIKDSTY